MASNNLCCLAGRLCNIIWLDDIAEEIGLPKHESLSGGEAGIEIFNNCFKSWEDATLIVQNCIPPSWALQQFQKETIQSGGQPSKQLVQHTQDVINSLLGSNNTLKRIPLQKEALKELIRLPAMQPARIGYSHLLSIIKENLLPLEWCDRQDFHEETNRMIREKSIKPEDFFQNTEVTEKLLAGTLPVCTWLRENLAARI